MTGGHLRHVLADWAMNDPSPRPHAKSTLSADDAERNYQRGYDAGVAEAGARMAREFAAEQERDRTLAEHHVAARVEEALARMEQQMGADLAVSLENLHAQLDAALANTLYRVLKPVLQDTIARRMVEEFATVIRSLGSDHEQLAIEVRGPDLFLETCRTSLSHAAFAVSFVPASRTAIAARIGETKIEATMTAWLDAIAGCNHA
jgi:hypothetical protein